MFVRTGPLALLALTLSIVPGCSRSNDSAAPQPAAHPPAVTPTAAAAPSAPVPTTPPAAAGGAAPGAGATTLATGAAPNFGVRALAPGFEPDPTDVRVVSGGNIDVSALNLGAGCVGFVSSAPDFNVQLTGQDPMLRFYVTASEDTTLVINDAQGNWHCNDDSNGGQNPMVDLRNVGPGLINVWVGSYRAGAQARGTLHVTELAGNHP